MASRTVSSRRTCESCGRARVVTTPVFCRVFDYRSAARDRGAAIARWLRQQGYAANGETPTRSVRCWLEGDQPPRCICSYCFYPQG